MNKKRDDQHTLFVHQQMILIALIAYFLSMLCGCVAQRGIDFGSWAMSGSDIEILRVFYCKDREPLTGEEVVLLVPPVGGMPAKNLVDLHNNIYQEMKRAIPAVVFTLEREGMLGRYISEGNITLIGDRFDSHEVSLVGKAAGASHVLCVRVCEFRAYIPQVLALQFTLIETATGRIVAEMKATFDASEQQVVVAVGNYLQCRRARKYDDQNLDIILRSPSEYSAFVASECCDALRSALWKKSFLKESYVLVDKER